jgi:V/A-type H+-transporting ATPase subunit D
MKTIVTPTRMVLLRTKKRAELAKRGHKLLKDKLDGLISRFIEITRETEKRLNELNKTLPTAMSKIIIAGSQMNCRELEEAAIAPNQKTGIEITGKNIMGVYIPIYKVAVKGSPISYGFANTPLELDSALIGFNQILPEIIALAGNIKALELIAKEVVKVKRRVNALEHILIPELTSQIKFIKMKLSEMERGYITSLMKIKDIVRAR